MVMGTTLLRRKEKSWCEVELTLESGKLSICGAEGRIVACSEAKKEALEYWRQYFEENIDALKDMALRYGTRTPLSAARKVLAVDGEYHGCDIHCQVNGEVYLTESCGQICSDLSKWFPEVIELLPYHLNNMHAECIHQEARGENWITHPEAICPDCGYKLGSQWLKREMPKSVLAKIKTFCALKE